MTPPRIGITLGDPGGIGPEIGLKALSAKDHLPQASYIIFGSRPMIEKEIKALGLDLVIPSYDPGAVLSLYETGKALPDIKKGVPTRENGEYSFLVFETAVREARAGMLQAIVTGPISKHSWEMAGVGWSGHTDFLSHLYPQAVMSFWSEKLKVALFTHHLPLKKALAEIRTENLVDFFRTLCKNIAKVHARKYWLLVAGINPHAGEEGLLGTEEEKEIVPAVERVREEGLPVSGPFPPDVVFREALNQPDKIVVALYHDQGLIPFKLVAFEEGVNVTLGLPFVRTSPDHGTAFDLAGLGKANPRSMIEAVRFACELAQPP